MPLYGISVYVNNSVTVNNRATQSGPLAVDASFQFVNIRDLDTIDMLVINVKQVTYF